MPAAAARPPRDDTECLDPDDTVDRPGQATRRRLLVRNAGLVIDGGLATAGGYAWRHGPGGALSYAAKRLRALRDTPMGTETILGISAIFTESPEFPGGFNGNTGTSRYAGASMTQGGPPRSSRASSPTTPRATAGRRMPDHPHLSHGSAATADRPHRRHDPHHCPRPRTTRDGTAE